MKEEQQEEQPILLYQSEEGVGELYLPQRYYSPTNGLQFLHHKLYGSYLPYGDVNWKDATDKVLKEKVRVASFATSSSYRSRAKAKFLIQQEMQFRTEEDIKKQYGLDKEGKIKNFHPDIEFEDDGKKIFGVIFGGRSKENWEDLFSDTQIIV